MTNGVLVMELKHRAGHMVKRAYILGRNEFSTFIMSSIGVLIYAIGVVWFTLPYHFPDAGVMGIALLLKYTIGFSPALFNLIANVALMLWGGRELPKRFLAWTVFCKPQILKIAKKNPHPHLGKFSLWRLSFSPCCLNHRRAGCNYGAQVCLS